MSLDAGYFRASGLRFIAEPNDGASTDSMTSAERVVAQFQNVETKNRTWAIALCKTQNGLAYTLDEGSELFIFNDLSYVMLYKCGFGNTGRLSKNWEPGDRFTRLFL